MTGGRGAPVDHGALCRSVQKQAPEREKRPRWRGRGPRSAGWRGDETDEACVKARGRWACLGRAAGQAEAVDPPGSGLQGPENGRRGHQGVEARRALRQGQARPFNVAGGSRGEAGVGAGAPAGAVQRVNGRPGLNAARPRGRRGRTPPCASAKVRNRAGKTPLDVAAQGLELVSISGRELYRPKGIDALYVRRRPRVRLTPLFSGGWQERGLRSGTQPTPLVFGFGEACRLAGRWVGEEAEWLTGLRSCLLHGGTKRLVH